LLFSLFFNLNVNLKRVFIVGSASIPGRSFGHEALGLERAGRPPLSRSARARPPQAGPPLTANPWPWQDCQQGWKLGLDALATESVPATIAMSQPAAEKAQDGKNGHRASWENGLVF